MFDWSKYEESILLRLDQCGFLFTDFHFVIENGLLCKLGSGAFSSVYLMDPMKEDGKQAALKVCGFQRNVSSWEDFSSVVEYQKEACLRSENIVQILGFKEMSIRFDDDNRIIEATVAPQMLEGDDVLRIQFILMEKLHPVLHYNAAGKRELYPEKISKGSQEETLKMIREVASALLCLHKDNVLHRDIKLENIFYSDEKDCYKIGDFGIAALTPGGVAMTIAFTGGYGAPEIVLRSMKEYDWAADVYSLGVCGYLLMNDLCFPGSKEYHVNEQLQYQSGYVFSASQRSNEKMKRLIDQMTAFSPEDRLRSMESVLYLIEYLFPSKEDYQNRREYLDERMTRNLTLVFCGLWLILAGERIRFPVAFLGFPKSKCWLWLSLLYCSLFSLFLEMDRKRHYQSYEGNKSKEYSARRNLWFINMGISLVLSAVFWLLGRGGSAGEEKLFLLEQFRNAFLVSIGISVLCLLRDKYVFWLLEVYKEQGLDGLLELKASRTKKSEHRKERGGD
ncbi:MAG: protein kinase [Lachnospiraceae bacterium]|nr:protein kinase [Lachnospiraceae bacterium]